MFSKIFIFSLTIYSVFSNQQFLNINNNKNELDRFIDWIYQFKISINDEFHHLKLFENWIYNDKFIKDHNSKNLSYTVAHNSFSGMSLDDFSNYMGFNNNMFQNQNNFHDDINVLNNNLQCYDLPSSIDWREKGAVTTPKDQGSCGSCWSFSTTGSLEGAFAIKTGNLTSFSEQQLVDCDNFLHGGTDNGCNGGLMENAFNWINKNGGLCAEDTYKYVSGITLKEGVCEKKCSLIPDSKVFRVVKVTPNSDLAMMNALTKGPVSIAIEADQSGFQLYHSGVFTSSCGTNLDHGVLLVGYGSENGQDYYIMKNSWGTSWGQNGFALLGRGSNYNDGSGQCGLLINGVYPLL